MILTNSRRIRWDRHEQHLLLQEVMRLVAERPHLTTLNAVQEAQKNVLPLARNRRIHTASQVEWVSRQRSGWVRPAAAGHPPPAEAVPDPLTEVVDMLAKHLAESMHHILKQALESAAARLAQAAAIEQEQTLTYLPASASRRTRIFVFGLMPAQEHEVRRTCGACFDFRFLKNASPDKLRSAVEWADKAYVMTKFISHDDYYVIKRAADESIEHVNGAVSSLMENLRQFHQQLNATSSAS